MVTSLCVGHWDTDFQFPMFQTGLGRPVAVSQTSIQKARTVLEEENSKRSGKKYTYGLIIRLMHNAQDQ